MNSLEEGHLKSRPKKNIFSEKTQRRLRDKAINKIKSRLLPDKKIIKIILIGSSVKNSFGKYAPPGFRGSLYSDFDFIVFAKDDYKVPKWLKKEPSAKPFLNNKLNLAYRNKKFIDNKFDIEIFFIREKSSKNKKYIELAEKAGIPINSKSKHKHIIIYKKQQIKAIISDIGGVIVMGDNMKTHYLPLIKSMKLDKEEFFKIYKKYVGKASRGKMTARQMINLMAADLGVNKKKLLENWIKYKKKSVKKNFELEKVYKKLKKDYVVASMSGVLDLHYKLFKEKNIYDVFQFNIYSFKVRTNKPDLKIYKLLLKRLKLQAKEVIFIDDNPVCVAPAKKLKIKTILYKNNKQLIEELNEKLK